MKIPVTTALQIYKNSQISQKNAQIQNIGIQ